MIPLKKLLELISLVFEGRKIINYNVGMIVQRSLKLITTQIDADDPFFDGEEMIESLNLSHKGL